MTRSFRSNSLRSHAARALGIVTLSLAALGAAQAQERFIVMASTTSTEQSGLFGHLLPEFKKATGVDVRVVALGTGQALDTARRGDADIVFVHDQAAEEKFVAEGYGLKRLPVMYNDFVIIGPKADPVGVRGNDVVEALKKLATSKADFISRGDKRHPLGRVALLEGRRRGNARRQGRRLQILRLWHGPGAQHGGFGERLCAGRPRHLAQLQEPRRPGGAGRRRQAPVQPIRRHRREPRQASAGETGAGAEFRRLGRFTRRAAGRLQATRSAASSSSSRTR